MIQYQPEVLIRLQEAHLDSCQHACPLNAGVRLRRTIGHQFIQAQFCNIKLSEDYIKGYLKEDFSRVKVGNRFCLKVIQWQSNQNLIFISFLKLFFFVRKRGSRGEAMKKSHVAKIDEPFCIFFTKFEFHEFWTYWQREHPFVYWVQFTHRVLQRTYVYKYVYF